MPLSEYTLSFLRDRILDRNYSDLISNYFPDRRLDFNEGFRKYTLKSENISNIQVYSVSFEE